MNVITVIMLYYHSNSDVLQTIFPLPNVVLMNVMAGRVFRNTMLFESWGETDSISTIQFEDI